eukprot:TRINITY_DN4868_c0_g1_i1.p1 TRINITY_DN4868_c0_g1~~TRINITY_DN4868_c0_g1_i1.p1  ORF type:complete len:696 (+),score=212.36 TRINITY_DN4868_c0_g1_i1:66-2153(+)
MCIRDRYQRRVHGELFLRISACQRKGLRMQAHNQVVIRTGETTWGQRPLRTPQRGSERKTPDLTPNGKRAMPSRISERSPHQSKDKFSPRSPDAQGNANTRSRSSSPVLPLEKRQPYDHERQMSIVEAARLKALEEPDTKPVLIVKKKEIQTRIVPKSEVVQSQPERKEISKAKPIEPGKAQHLMKKAEVSRAEEVVVTREPNFKMRSGEEYVEEQTTRIHATELLPPGKLSLTPLANRDEYYFISGSDERRFYEDERRAVAIRRQEYANRQKGVQRDVILTSVEARRIRASIIIQRWFRNRRSLLQDQDAIANDQAGQALLDLQRLPPPAAQPEPQPELDLDRLPPPREDKDTSFGEDQNNSAVQRFAQNTASIVQQEYDRLRAEEDAARRRAEENANAARRRAEDDAARRRIEEDAARRREEDAIRRREQELAWQRAEEERRRREAEAARQRTRDDEAALSQFREQTRTIIRDILGKTNPIQEERPQDNLSSLKDELLRSLRAELATAERDKEERQRREREEYERLIERTTRAVLERVTMSPQHQGNSPHVQTPAPAPISPERSRRNTQETRNSSERLSRDREAYENLIRSIRSTSGSPSDDRMRRHQERMRLLTEVLVSKGIVVDIQDLENVSDQFADDDLFEEFLAFLRSLHQDASFNKCFLLLVIFYFFEKRSSSRPVDETFSQILLSRK